MGCRNRIVNVLTAKVADGATVATEQAGLRCKKEKYVLPAIRTAAANARTVAARVDSTQPETHKKMTNDELRISNAPFELVIRNS
jgi:hypothetical protein